MYCSSLTRGNIPWSFNVFRHLRVARLSTEQRVTRPPCPAGVRPPRPQNQETWSSTSQGLLDHPMGPGRVLVFATLVMGKARGLSPSREDHEEEATTTTATTTTAAAATTTASWHIHAMLQWLFAFHNHRILVTPLGRKRRVYDDGNATHGTSTTRASATTTPSWHILAFDVSIPAFAFIYDSVKFVINQWVDDCEDEGDDDGDGAATKTTKSF